MEGSGYSYQGLPDPSAYYPPQTFNQSSSNHAPFMTPTATPNIFISEAGPQHPQEGLQTPNTRARRIVHEVIV